MPQKFYHLPQHLPVVWTSPTSVHVGVDPPLARIHNIPDTAAPLIHAVTTGAPASGLRMMAKNHQVDDSWVDHFLSALEPLWSLPQPPAPPRWLLWSTSAAVGGLLPLAHHSGFSLSPPESEPQSSDIQADGVFVVADYVIHPHWLTLLAHQPLPHCPIVFSDQTVIVGPRVIPGSGPCLVCVESHNRDNTPQWLEVASQLWGKVSPLHSAHVHGMAWFLALSLMTPALHPGVFPPGMRAIFRPGTGKTVWEEVLFHPDCRCRGPEEP